jgi:hypothetical protein
MTNDYRHVLHRHMKIPLGNTPKVVVAENDGGVYLTNQGGFSGSNRIGEVPLLSLEVSIPFNCEE